VRSSTLGQFDMRELLDRFLTERDATRAADSWAGDAYQFLRCEATPALFERWTADDEASASRLAGALRRWARAWSGGRVPDGAGWFSGPRGAGRVRRTAVSVDLVLAGDAAAARRIGGRS
jgi:hypothetical protein